MAQHGLGTALVGLLKYAEARPILEEALASALALNRPDRAGETRISLGLCAFGEGRRDDADHEWSQAVETFKAIGNPQRELQALALLVVIRKRLVDRPLHERFLVLAGETGDAEGVATAHLQWADALLLDGLGGAAIRELELAAKLLQAGGFSNTGTLARVETSLALALRQHGANERAVPHYQAAMVSLRRLDDLEGLYQATNGLATVYAELGRWSQARVQFDAALAVAQRMGSPRLINDAMSAAGWVALARRRPDLAVPLLEKASAGPIDHWTAPYAFTNLATAYRQLHRPADARTAADRGLALAREREMANAEAEALLERAQDLDLLKQSGEALDDARGVLALLERVRGKLSPADFLRRGFGDIHEHAYDVVISLLEKQHRTTEALAAAEQSRARAFADLLAARAGGRAAAEEQIPLLGESPPTVEHAAAPEAQVDRPQDAPATAPTPADLAALARRLHSVIVEYWIGEAVSVAWVVSEDGRVRGRTLQVTRTRLSARVDETAADPMMRRATGSNPYRTLYTQLVAPIEAWLPRGGRLTIIPHGSLFRLSFAALVDDHGKYLVERYAIHYAPGGAVLRLTERRTSEEPSRQGPYLLVADPSPLPILPDERPLPDLPGARAEVAAIAQIVGPARCTVFTGGAAEEGLVSAQLPHASVIHLATHAIVGDRDTLSSFIALGRRSTESRDPAHDGRLTASEVYDAPLSADLVVLSACRSARGRVSSDGIAGLTRAFISAGAPTVVAALWDVADVSSARLMPQFYEQYARGVSKDEALRRAQLAVLADLRRGRLTTPGPNGPVRLPDEPAYWAGFVVVGAP